MGIADLISSRIKDRAGTLLAVTRRGRVRDTNNRSALPVGTIDLHLNDGNSDDDDDFEDRHRTAVYDPTFIPSGGWDRWIEWAIGNGKVARVIQSRAKNAMCGRLISDDKDLQDHLDAFARKIHLSTGMIQFFMDYEGRGRPFMEPVWSYDAFGRKKDLEKLNFLFPSSVRVFRDNSDDVRDLKEYLKTRKVAKQILYGLSLKSGSGFNVIGYIQNYGEWIPWELNIDPDGDGDPSVFFFPDELIFLPRYPSPMAKDGLALPRQNYVIIMNKLGIERDQAIMARRHGDPKHKFVIPDTLWGKRDEIKRELKRALRAGYDFFFKGRKAQAEQDAMDVTIIAPTGNPMSVAKAQDHVDNEFNAAMGYADSFTESGSSNRSVGEIQLDFFERDLAPERQLIAEILEDKLINPWLKTQGYKEGDAWFVFEDLSVDDKVKKSTLIAPLLPYLPSSVLIRFLDNMGYPLTKAEIAAIQAPIPTPAVPKTPADPQTPSPDQVPPNVQAALDAIAKTTGRKPEEVLAAALEWKVTEYAAQAGIPKPVLRSAAPAREQFKQEIEDMRDDIANILGL